MCVESPPLVHFWSSLWIPVKDSGLVLLSCLAFIACWCFSKAASMSPRSSSTEVLLFFPAALVNASCRGEERKDRKRSHQVVRTRADLTRHRNYDRNTSTSHNIQTLQSEPNLHDQQTYLQFLLFHADFRVLLCCGQGSCQRLLPLALGPLGNRGGNGDRSLHNIDRGVFW